MEQMYGNLLSLCYYFPKGKWYPLGNRYKKESEIYRTFELWKL